MNNFAGVSTLQYMGSKYRILDEVCTPIIENKNIETVIDLFAGTGSVGYALKPHFSIISNDLEYYAYIINEGILNGCQISDSQLTDFLEASKSLYQQIRNNVAQAVFEEEEFFKTSASSAVIEEYKIFCNETPSVISQGATNPIFESLAKLVSRVVPGNERQELNFPALFLTYYANSYFGINQCCEIDAIRASIDAVDDVRIRNVLLTALMGAMSNTATTTTHFAQFLKINGISSYVNIINKRSLSIFDQFCQFLHEYKQNGLLNSVTANAECHNLDYLELLHSVPLDETTMVYADPPYFKEHYSRYYHVLNTLCKYDYPTIALNPQTHEFSVGRYREERNVSDFGKRRTALSAFREMIDICARNKAWLTISYSSNSIVNIEDIASALAEYYDVSSVKIPFKHSKQGRSSTSSVEEYLFTCKPINGREVVGQKQVRDLLSVLSKTKSHTDNPAGFMHNYMARKPFNIVSEIIKKLCPENGIVYDPMMGSGTTLIEASKLNIRSIGTDINPLAYKITSASLIDWDLPRIKTLLDEFVNSVTSQCETLYYYIEEDETRVIERCHFDKVNKNNMRLVPTSYWYKTCEKGRLTGRKKAIATTNFISLYSSYKNVKPKTLSDAVLIPNSRIAISQDDTVFSYFCARNILVLDVIVCELEKRKKQYGYAVLELMVSSAINLIKLSDKKASSQIPYWTPQRDVTSRNAIFILEKKKDTILKGLNYLHEKCKAKLVESFTEFTTTTGALITDSPAQNISYSILPKNSINLILTDPPYTDQVPYLEYSQLWAHILGWQKGSSERLVDELVVSDAPSRNKDKGDFNMIFRKIIKRTANSVKDGGHFVMFYHSFDLSSWHSILSMMAEYGFAYQGQAPIAAPRKSFKTIMSPKSTLDGNYVIVFRKRRQHSMIFEGTIHDAERGAIESARRLIASGSPITSQDLYDNGVLKHAIEMGYLGLLASKYRTLIDVVEPVFECVDGYWRER